MGRRKKQENCGYCPRVVLLTDEPTGKYFKKDGKVMCMICRAVKLSSFEKQIKSLKKKMIKDVEEQIKIADQAEYEKVLTVAAKAAEYVEKNYKE